MLLCWPRRTAGPGARAGGGGTTGGGRSKPPAKAVPPGGLQAHRCTTPTAMVPSARRHAEAGHASCACALRTCLAVSGLTEAAPVCIACVITEATALLSINAQGSERPEACSRSPVCMDL